MPHVQINAEGFFVDGVKVEVHADDFKVDLRDLPRATVRCTIPADSISIDLPDAVLDIEREGQRNVADELRLIRSLLEGVKTATEAAPERVGQAINAAAARGRRGGGR